MEIIRINDKLVCLITRGQTDKVLREIIKSFNEEGVRVVPINIS